MSAVQQDFKILTDHKQPFQFEDKQCSPININLVYQSEANKNRVPIYTQGRSDVKCSNKKQRKQKGSGSARLSDKSAPQLRGGAAAWGPNGRKYQVKVNRKQRQSALKSILYQKLNNNKIIFIDNLDCNVISTKLAIKQLEQLNVIDKKVLILQEEFSQNTLLSYKNLYKTHLLKICGLNLISLCKADYIVCATSALNVINQRFQPNRSKQ